MRIRIDGSSSTFGNGGCGKIVGPLFFSVFLLMGLAATALLAIETWREAATCYVDPGNPAEAVLNRDFRASYLLGLFPLLFLTPGLLVLFLGIRQYSRPGAKAGLPVVEDDHAPSRVLEARISPVGKLLGAIVFCLLWNGLVSVFVYHLVDEWMHGTRQWFLAVFLIPFVLVGLAVFVSIFYFLLALANPRPSPRISPTSPRLGQSVHLEWRFSGASRRIRELTITMQGAEEATYRRGTTTKTDKEVFATIGLTRVGQDMSIARGSSQAQVSADTMHSFSGSSNKIVWSIVLHGDIDRWPDVNQSYEITVRPRALGDLES